MYMYKREKQNNKEYSHLIREIINNNLKLIMIILKGRQYISTHGTLMFLNCLVKTNWKLLFILNILVKSNKVCQK